MAPTHDYDLANQTPASYRTDHNSLNLAIAGCNASSSGITTTFAHMLFADVSSSGWMRQRNAADSTFNYIHPLGVPGGIFTYAGSPQGNHACKYQGQPIYDTSNNAYYLGTTVGTSSQATWAAVQFSSSINTGFPKGFMQGLVPKYASANTFTIAAGGCRDSGDAANIAISTAYTMDITVSGAGGLSTSETESTSGSWYYCFAMRKSTDGTVNFILTASSSGAVLPSGYDQTRMLPFAIRNSTQANFIPWYVIEGWPYRPKINYRVRFAEMGASTVGPTNVLDGGNSTSYTTLSLANYVPPIARVAEIRHGHTGGSGTIQLYIRKSGSTEDEYIYVTTSIADASDNVVLETSTNQVVEYKMNTGSADMAIYGYVVTEL